jgi:hypothetical protein
MINPKIGVSILLGGIVAIVIIYQHSEITRLTEANKKLSNQVVTALARPIPTPLKDEPKDRKMSVTFEERAGLLEKVTRVERELSISKAWLQASQSNYLDLASRFQKTLKDIAPLWTPEETATYLGDLQRRYSLFRKKFPSPPPIESLEYPAYAEILKGFNDETNSIMDAVQFEKTLGLDNPEGAASSKALMMKTALALNDTQAARVKEIFRKYYTEAALANLMIENKPKTNAEYWTSQRGNLDQRFKNEVLPLLTSEQQTQFSTVYKWDGLWLTSFGETTHIQ